MCGRQTAQILVRCIMKLHHRDLSQKVAPECKDDAWRAMRWSPRTHPTSPSLNLDLPDWDDIAIRLSSCLGHWTTANLTDSP
jgi:hypothetical protein